MASAKDQQQEPEYGKKVEQEQTQEALDATAAMEAENAPNVVPPTEEEAPQEESPQETTEPRQKIRLTSLMQVVPPHLLMRGVNAPRKPEADRAYDVGLLWRTLSQAQGVPPSIKAIADRLTGEER